MVYLLPHLLVETANKYPDHVAVWFEDERITYRELDRRSSCLAASLISNGLRKGDRVGIFIHKSIESIISVFGILKAGGIYVPLDPNSPAARVAYILSDCGIRQLITSQRKLLELQRLDAQPARLKLQAAFLVDIKDGESGIATQPDSLELGRTVSWSEVLANQPLAAPVEGVSSDVAYVLYTSGSTGMPKGVMISHRAAFTFIDWTFERFAVSHEDIISSHAPLHFDLSIFDIFTTIKAGGTIAIVPEWLSAFPVKLSEFISTRRISVWYSVPSALTLMLQRGNFASRIYPDLRVILFAGEVFPLKYLRALRDSTSARLFNLYGPTETNVCTYYEVTQLDPARTEPIPIGTAISNYEVFALNAGGRPIEAGEEGELFARGPGLLTGYWGDPEKTRKTLVTNPLHTHYDDLVYKTGDIVSVDADSNFLYRGRRDHMIKSKGYRIELGEIETALYAHPQIVEAAVVPVPDEEVTNRLKAYVVCEPPGALTPQQIQHHCQQRIPRYMVPETIEICDRLPKTSTGKVDRQSLASRMSSNAVPSI